MPLRAFVETFTNMRFEPAGMTDDPDIRFASSIIDYIFRRLAVEYLSHEERAELNILTIEERMQPTLPGVEETVIETGPGPATWRPTPLASRRPTSWPCQIELDARPVAASRRRRRRHATRRSACSAACRCSGPARCHACPSCGSTSGCS